VVLVTSKTLDLDIIEKNGKVIMSLDGIIITHEELYTPMAAFLVACSQDERGEFVLNNTSVGRLFDLFIDGIRDLRGKKAEEAISDRV